MTGQTEDSEEITVVERQFVIADSTSARSTGVRATAAWRRRRGRCG